MRIFHVPSTHRESPSRRPDHLAAWLSEFFVATTLDIVDSAPPLVPRAFILRTQEIRLFSQSMGFGSSSMFLRTSNALETPTSLD